jgi:hypothetical protein
LRPTVKDPPARTVTLDVSADVFYQSPAEHTVRLYRAFAAEEND